MQKFSIILPVRNGGEYVKECVNSILAQSFTGFELLVLDNNSSDGTLEWLNAINDQRINVYPSAKSLSIEENWGRIVALEKGEFITLIGHDDLLENNYLEVLNGLILKNPEASLYQTHFKYIDSTGEIIRNCLPMVEKETAVSFLQKFLKKEIDVMGTGFMIRSADYEMLGGIPDYPNLLFADFELWINLTKQSFKATAQDSCFSFRLHQSVTTISTDDKFHLAFERFVSFLQKLKKEGQDFNSVITENVTGFLLYYCRGLCHRLLRTPKKKRSGLTVKKLINSFNMHAVRLNVENNFHPENHGSILLAKMLDATAFGRVSFLIFKKMFKKPVLK
ncbi:MAG: glycosyltransferase [Chitinophagaceae bacterium]